MLFSDILFSDTDARSGGSRCGRGRPRSTGVVGAYDPRIENELPASPPLTSRRRLFFVPVSKPGSTDMARPVVGEADPAIVALEEQLRAAQLGADVAAVDRLIADELLFTGPDGQLGTKSQDLDSHRSAPFAYSLTSLRNCGCVASAMTYTSPLFAPASTSELAVRLLRGHIATRACARVGEGTRRIAACRRRAFERRSRPALKNNHRRTSIGPLV